jgi:hypothetical protein
MMATPQVHRAQALSQASKKCNSAGRQEESAGGRPLGRPSKDNWCCIAGTSEVFSSNKVCFLRDPLPPRPSKTFLSTNRCKRNITMGEQAAHSSAYPLRHPMPLPPGKISISSAISLARSIQDQKREVLRDSNIDGHLLRRPLNFPPAATALLHPLRRVHLSLSLHFRSWTAIGKT